MTASQKRNTNQLGISEPVAARYLLSAMISASLISLVVVLAIFASGCAAKPEHPVIAPAMNELRTGIIESITEEIRAESFPAIDSPPVSKVEPRIPPPPIPVSSSNLVHPPAVSPPLTIAPVPLPGATVSIQPLP